MSASLAIGFATAGLLAYAGRLIHRRPTFTVNRLAIRAFALWWYAASLVIFIPNLRTLLFLVGVQDVPLHTALVYFANLPLAAALAGLMF